ncbi:MAG: phosphoribosylglycinamide synthetase C domain-containing protein [Phenylobacterium sp.]
MLATRGYPGPAEAGSVIKGAEGDFGPGVVVFQASTSRAPDGSLRAGSGRALNVCATGATLQEARDRAYAAVAAIDWPDGFHRTDIGWRALGVRPST